MRSDRLQETYRFRQVSDQNSAVRGLHGLETKAACLTAVRLSLTQTMAACVAAHVAQANLKMRRARNAFLVSVFAASRVSTL